MGDNYRYKVTVAGSSPVLSTRCWPWCKGSTRACGALSGGSIPLGHPKWIRSKHWRCNGLLTREMQVQFLSYPPNTPEVEVVDIPRCQREGSRFKSGQGCHIARA